MLVKPEFALRALLLFIICFETYANSDCNTIFQDQHVIRAKDFQISRQVKKSLFCTAFFCSSDLNALTLHIGAYRHHENYTTLIYFGPNTIQMLQDCSQSGNDTVQLSDDYFPCPEVGDSRNIEIHIRIDNPTETDKCVFPNFFNMTIERKQPTKKACQGYQVALPSSTSCHPTVNSTLDSCIMPTCLDTIENQTLDTENFLHQFPASQNPQTCILHFKTKSDSVQIYFSPNIRDSLFIYGSSLLIPKLDIGSCNDFHSTFTLENSSDSFFVLYKNDGELQEQGSLIIKTIEQSCIHMPVILNGTVERIMNSKNEVLEFYCNKDFDLMGASQILCEEMLWTKPPVCILKNKSQEKLMSDDSKIAGSKPVSFDPIPLPFEGARSPILTHYEAPSKSLDHHKNKGLTTKIPLKVLDTLAAETNESLIVPDIKILETSATNDSDASNTEGSGDEPSDEIIQLDLEHYETTIFPLNDTVYNDSESLQEEDYELSLISIPTLEHNFILIVSIGAGLLLILILTIVSIICCKKKGRCRSASSGKFDTFQNPIYEKPVHVPVSIGMTDRDKINMSDLTESSHLN